ncbi:hypothetical protein AVEN_126946-1 [Araneus ventricosus]|uniref:Uncharacterized protein n=1 Tax=Araneus ventricosus TaxID=182803 RepID=A0A4Y2EBZ3_ARAVE|nr:hypothetical protein AVEN_126946-1 [Araneus ventricosus]
MKQSSKVPKYFHLYRVIQNSEYPFPFFQLSQHTRVETCGSYWIQPPGDIFSASDRRHSGSEAVSTSKDPPCVWSWYRLNMTLKVKLHPTDMPWKFRERVSAEMNPSSADQD